MVEFHIRIWILWSKGTLYMYLGIFFDEDIQMKDYLRRIVGKSEGVMTILERVFANVGVAKVLHTLLCCMQDLHGRE